MATRILFLINPVSGIGKQKIVEKLIESDLNSEKFEVTIKYTQYKAHAREIVGLEKDSFEIIVAVGGDGTVNEVASKLIGTNTALAIIPTGSGNGLARYLNIPLKVQRAIQALNFYRIKTIDTLKVNQYTAVNVAGIGFDAHISHSFEGRKLRGPLSYAQLITTEFAKYESHHYDLVIDGKMYSRNSFIISFANSSQYGNNVHIAPKAIIDDGLVDVCFINDFPKYMAPAVLLTLFGKTMEKNDFEEIVRAQNIEVIGKRNINGHIDGEPVKLGKSARIEVVPKSLKVVVPPENWVVNWFDPFKDIIPNIEGFVKDIFSGIK